MRAWNLPAAILPLLLLSVSCSGTIGGNPGGKSSRILIEVGPASMITLSHLSICPTQVRMIAASGGTDQTAALAPSEISVLQSKTVASITVLTQEYQGAELTLSAGCSTGRSLQVTNGNGTYQTTDATVLSFTGSFTPSGVDGEPVRMDIAPAATQLASVSSGAQLKDAAQAASGAIGVPTCPAGYVLVPANTTHTTYEFCVMKYEAKQSASNAPESVPAGLPWTGLNGVDARHACKDLGPRYELLDTLRWQTIARNIESVAANWANGAVGDAGGLSRGHSDGAPAANLAASSSDADACTGTGQSCSNSVWDSQRRTHVLSNGSVIWDFAGNTWEWLADESVTSPSGNNDGPATALINGGKFNYGPAGNWSAYSVFPFAGMGYAYVDIAAGGVARGGSWAGNSAGVFATDLNRVRTTPTTDGFRCYYILHWD